MEQKKPTLAEKRKTSELTQSMVAYRIGRELTTYRNWETGRYLPTILDAENICKALGCSLDDIDWTREYRIKHPQA